MSMRTAVFAISLAALVGAFPNVLDRRCADAFRDQHLKRTRGNRV